MATTVLSNDPYIDRNDPNLRTLNGLFNAFMSQTSPRILAGLAGTGIAARLACGGWTNKDAAIPIAIAALWPIQETVLHRFILHARPFTMFGRTIDVGKFHREHHLHPEDLNGFVPLGLYYATPFVGLGIARALAGAWPQALTAFSVWFILALNYEWSHFFVHASAYQPKTWWGRLLRRNHMRHHFHNETFWWEVSTAGLVDRLVMVAKGYSLQSDQRDIPRSPTVRTVHAV